MNAHVELCNATDGWFVQKERTLSLMALDFCFNGMGWDVCIDTLSLT